MAIISGVTISGGGVTILGGGAPATDPYFMYNSLLLPGNGTNTAQNNTFLDGSTNNFAITRAGNTTQGTFSPYGANWSNYFDGNGDYLTTQNNAAFNLASNNFTIETFFYTGSTSDQVIISAWNTTSFEIIYFSGTLYCQTNSSAPRLTTTTWPLNQWNHIAFVRSGNTYSAYLNGTRFATATDSQSVPNINAAPTIGVRQGGTSFPFNGYLSNLRVVNGTAVYDPTLTTLTVPTAPLTAITNTSLLTCQNNRFIDNSTNVFAITVNGDTNIQRFSPFSPTQAYDTSTIGGSGYIATAATSYLSFTDSSNNLDLGGAVASFETWIYPTAATCIIAVKSGGTANYNTSTGVEWSMPLAAQQFIFYYNNGGSYSALTDPTTGRPLNQWYHYAVATNATTISLFINGVRVATATANVSKPTDRTLVRVGEDLGGNGGICYLSDTRFIRGAGAYDPTASTITIPSAPLTAVANTQLLLNYTNVGIIDNAMMNNLETVGNAQISTTQSKFGGSSMYFDGTGDWLFMPPNSNNDLGTGNFTIEMWIYPTAALNTFRMLMAKATNTDETYISLSAGGTGGQLDVYGGSIVFNLNNSISLNTWAHLAIVRVGNTWTAYVNGTSLGSNTSSLAFNLSGIYGTYIGRYGQNPAHEWNGYIDDLRITKGYARYTSNFTPPTTAFPLN